MNEKCRHGWWHVALSPCPWCRAEKAEAEVERLREQLHLCNVDQLNAEAEVERLRGLARAIWDSRWVSEDQAYIDAVCMAAEILGEKQQ